MTSNDWRTRVLEAVESTEKSRRLQTTRWGSQFHIRLTFNFKDLVRQAAEARGITIVSYMRRAIAKQVAADLAIAWEDVIIHSPYPSRYGQKVPDDEHRVDIVRIRRDGRYHPTKESQPDDGTGFGDWT